MVDVYMMIGYEFKFSVIYENTEKKMNKSSDLRLELQRINLECLIRSEWLLQVEWFTDIWINQIYTIRWSVTATVKIFQTIRMYMC